MILIDSIDFHSFVYGAHGADCNKLVIYSESMIFYWMANRKWNADGRTNATMTAPPIGGSGHVTSGTSNHLVKDLRELLSFFFLHEMTFTVSKGGQNIAGV